MPLRFYRRFRAGPFRLNFSKSGMSYSFGGRHAWLTFGHGRADIHASANPAGTERDPVDRHRRHHRRCAIRYRRSTAQLNRLIVAGSGGRCTFSPRKSLKVSDNPLLGSPMQRL